MEKVYASPSRYVQGAGVLAEADKYISPLGKNALLLCDDIVYGIVGKTLIETLKENAIESIYVPFNGEASLNEIQRVSEIGRQEKADVVIGLGGGKTIDAAKAISDELNLPVAILPTIASTDAPTSALSVIYSDEGVFERYLFYKKNPELVLVDSQVVANAPTRLLASGIADAMATWVEGRSIIKAGGKTMAGGLPTLAAEAIALKCHETLFEFGLEAVAACEKNEVNPALEAVIEANTLLSGIGFESCGLAAAHAVHNGFTALEGEIHNLTHGEKVAYGILTQLMLEKRPEEEFNQFVTFFRQLGLPTTLEDLKLKDAKVEDLNKVAELATQEGETIHEMKEGFTAKDVTDALLAVDSYVLKNFS